MKNLFEHTSAPWIRYSNYEYKTDNNDNLYITVSKDAKPEMYRPMQKAGQLVMDAVNVGLAAMHKVPEEELKESVLGFVRKYGFLGFMTALPTTADFITYESVYLPKNHFIKEESLSTEDYLSYFYPFNKPDFRKKGVESGWSVTDREGIAIAMAMGNAPQAVTMGFQKEYAEKYDWIVKEFTDLAFTFMTSFLYYLDYDSLDEDTRSLYRQGISAFGGIAPTYRIALEKDAPVIVWDFHSLLIMVQMCFSFMLTDKDSDMRMCKHCKKLLLQAEKEMSFAVRNVKTNIMYTNQEKRKRGTKTMIENRNVNIITDADGKKLALINDIRFKGKRQIDWDDVKQYLEGYVGDYYEIEESAERIYIGNELPEEYTESESRKSLMGANAKAKANAATAIPELIQIASNPAYEENRKEKHNKNAKYGWYRYDVRFALPVYEENVLVRYNIFHARLLINHAENGRKYLYDILAIKKETSKP